MGVLISSGWKQAGYTIERVFKLALANTSRHVLLRSEVLECYNIEEVYSLLL